VRRPQPVRPAPGQESVWDYPRPPAVEVVADHVVVEFAGRVIAESRRPLRVLETSHPPVYYLPPTDVDLDVLVPSARATWCEFKGQALYYDVVARDRREPAAAWFYPNPAPGYGLLAGAIAFYPGRMGGCWIDGEPVQALQGDFYGGWVTPRVVGPFKGAEPDSLWL
jgi:uncharacterized protein (DUF427 family)